MAFVDLSISQKKMREIRENGELIPVKFGFKTWNQLDKGRLIMGSKKCTVLIGGEPNHGKSQVAYELTLQMIEKHGYKVALFSTESGDVEKIFSILCSMYIGKPYSKIRPDGKPNYNAMTDGEAEEAEYFLLQHLYIFKQDRKDSNYQTLENIYLQLHKAEEFYNIKFDSLVIDPVYDVQDFEPKAAEVLRVLNRFNLEAEENNRFDIMVNHVGETSKITDKNGNRKKLLALPDEFYGGKNNQRKAQLMLLVHRPIPTVDINGRWLEGFGEGDTVVKENQTDIHVLKVKPEGIAKFGKYPIFYDWKKRRYYEADDDEGVPYVSYADCTRFKNERPNFTDVTKITASPEEAFGPANYNSKNDEDEEFPF